MNQQPTLSVASTHWAERDEQAITKFITELPAVHKSNMELWQLRVDRKAETPFMPHASLFLMEAIEYARTEIEPGKGNSEPTGRSFTFVVIGKDRHDAGQKVKDQLHAHGFDPVNFMLRTGSHLLCLF